MGWECSSKSKKSINPLDTFSKSVPYSSIIFCVTLVWFSSKILAGLPFSSKNLQPASFKRSLILIRALASLLIRFPSVHNRYNSLHLSITFLTICYEYAISISVKSKFCLILAHPDLSADRVVLSWLWINNHIWKKEI